MLGTWQESVILPSINHAEILMVTRDAQKIRTKGDTEYESELSVTGWEAEASESLRSDSKSETWELACR